MVQANPLRATEGLSPEDADFFEKMSQAEMNLVDLTDHAVECNWRVSIDPANPTIMNFYRGQWEIIITKDSNNNMMEGRVIRNLADGHDLLEALAME